MGTKFEGRKSNSKMNKADKKVKQYLKRAEKIYSKFKSSGTNVLGEFNLNTQILEERIGERNVVKIAKMIQLEEKK